MDTLLVLVPSGVVLTVSLFLIFEYKAISVKRARDLQGVLCVNTDDLYTKFQRYDTLPNTIGFFIGCYVVSLFLASVTYNPSYGLLHALSYIFATTFIGTLFIFGLKMKHNILIQVFATFLYGAPHIIAASLAFLTRYLIA